MNAESAGRAEHASVELIGAYARGDTDIAADEMWALEAHLEACGVCRARLADAVDCGVPAVASLVEAVWSGLEPELGTAAAAPARRRRRQPVWLSAWLTPVMAPWLAMTVGVVLIAMALDVTEPAGFGEGVSLLLLLAPVLPLLGVAASWSRALDPAYELTAAAPRAGLYLVLRRTASVLAVVVPVLLLAGWPAGVSAAQWLLPCLALTSASLALGGVFGVARAALGLAAVWAAGVMAPSLVTRSESAALDASGLPVWGLLLALGTGVVIARRGAYTAVPRLFR
ncbi:membrane protein [Streptomyces caelestis]|uniref:Membrane protein n=2 Tax=Streptomyces TaxID=1883 RepID=A0A0M9X677_9ACTN|nr:MULTISPECIES: zf-HC2 domain-containing protein [Streptomyces]KOT31767.1 membrane protein [Streptomyces caelestis]KOV20763.1 membrane protein [Streptomyces sp. XY152]